MRGRTFWKIATAVLVVGVLTSALFWLRAGGETEERSGPVVHFSRGEQQVATFKVELATTPEQQIEGLMGREELPADQGMLFVFVPARDVGMWMKNMLISLDFLFMDERGRVVYIAEDVPPCPAVGECPNIAAGQPVKYVLELPAGTVERYGLALGDLMRTSLQ